MKRYLLPALLSGFLVACGPVSALVETEPRIEELKAENALLRARIEALEKAFGEIREKLSDRTDAASASEETTQVSLAATAVSVRPSVASKYPVDVYGYLKLDMAWDTSRTDTGNFARWALSDSVVAPDDRQFSQTVNQTRIGLNFKGPDEGRAKVSGQYEIDLYGGGAENSAMVRTRHAFFQVDWPGEVSLLMGQTWDLVGPQNPNTLDYTVAWQGGNLGFRHPQLRVTKGIEAGDCRLVFQAAASRKIGDATTFGSSPDTGADSGSPALQGRIGYTFPTGKGLKSTIGVWGHDGSDEYDYDAAGNSVAVRSHSKGVDLAIAFSKTLAIKGEVWEGKNLDEYQGGIAQGVIVTAATGTVAVPVINRVVNNASIAGLGRFVDAVGMKSRGGWFELNAGPFAAWRYNIGFSYDDPDDDLLPNGSRTHNRLRWINAMYDLNAAVQMGLEYMRLETEYKNRLSGADTRLQTSFIYKF